MSVVSFQYLQVPVTTITIKFTTVGKNGAFPKISSRELNKGPHVEISTFLEEF